MKREIRMGSDFLRIVVRDETSERLQQTCFRRERAPLAGNFKQWTDATYLFQNQTVQKAFAKAVSPLEEGMTHRFTIAYPQPIGWSSTDDLCNYKDADLEYFNPSKRSSAFRVIPSRTDLLAPATRLITFAIEYKDEFDVPTAVVHSIYPGRNIGELIDDITDREQCIFFDWEHPGEPFR